MPSPNPWLAWLLDEGLEMIYFMGYSIQLSWYVAWVCAGCPKRKKGGHKK